MSAGYIYLLKPLSSITNNENVYKIGKTHRHNFKRFNEYPYGSILLLQTSCSDCDSMEKKLLTLFNNNFILRRQYGIEYFEGDVFAMKEIINNEISSSNGLKTINNIVTRPETLNNSQKNNVNGGSLDTSNVENSPINNERKQDFVAPINNKIEKKMFKCDCCNFTTYMRNSYDKHLYTKKHQVNEDKIIYSDESFDDIMKRRESITNEMILLHYTEYEKYDELKKILLTDPSIQREMRRSEIRRKKAESVGVQS